MKISELRFRTAPKNLPDGLRECLRTRRMLSIDVCPQKIGDQIYRQHGLAGSRTAFDYDDSLSLVLEAPPNCVLNLLIHDQLLIQQHPWCMPTDRNAQMLHQLSARMRFSTFDLLKHAFPRARRQPLREEL